MLTRVRILFYTFSLAARGSLNKLIVTDFLRRVLVFLLVVGKQNNIFLIATKN